MEDRRLNFEAPVLSMRRISTKQEVSGESEKKNNEKPMEALSSCLKTDCSIVRPVYLPNRSFDHLTGAASVPFFWEQIPGRPKDVMGSENLKERLIEKNNLETELEQDDDDDAVDTVSLNDSFSVNCSYSGLSDFEKSVCDEEEEEEEESQKFCEGRITEYRDLMMSRFLPAAKAMALKHQSQSQSWSQSQSQSQQQNQISSCFEKQQQQMRLMINREAAVLAVLSRCKDMKNDDDDDDDDDDYHHHHHEDYYDYDKGMIDTRVGKKACGLLPKLCVKNSLNVLNPVPAHQIKTCQNLGKMKSGKISNHSSLSESGFVGTRIPRNSISRIQSRNGRMATDHKTRSCYRIQEVKLLAEEVAERRRINVLKSFCSEQRSLVAVAVSPPPLPKSPSESWLWRTLPSVMMARVDSKKLWQKTRTLESMKWETIVKTS